MKNLVISLPSDEQLIARFKEGDHKSLGFLYERYYSKVYRKCMSFVKHPEDAFDLTQDILMKSFGNIDTFKGNSSFSTWLFAITNNHCIAFLRKSRKQRFENIETCYNIADEVIDTDERIRREQQVYSLDTKLNEISEEDRKMLVLKYRHNYSIGDLQKEFNLQASAVKMRLQRARHKVEQKLNSEVLPVAI